MPSAVFPTPAEYFNAVKQCEEKVLAAVKTPGINFAPLMESINHLVVSIFETRRANAFGPTVALPTSFLHHFVAEYFTARNQGLLNEEFREAMLKLSEEAGQGNQVHASVPSGQLNQAAPSINGNETGPSGQASGSGHESEVATTNVSRPAVAAAAKVVPAKTVPAKVAPAKAVPAKPVPRSKDAQPANEALAAKPKPGVPKTTFSHVSPPPQPSHAPAQDNSNRVTRVAMQLAAQHGMAQQQATEPAKKPGKGKGKQVESDAGSKKHKREERKRAIKSEYAGQGIFYQIPCDWCAKNKLMCEKRVAHREPKKGVASCLSCARASRKCVREDNPDLEENTMVYTTASGEIVPRLICRPRNSLAPADETDDKGSEVARPVKKAKPMKSAEYVEDSDMDVDPSHPNSLATKSAPDPAPPAIARQRAQTLPDPAPSAKAPKPGPTKALNTTRPTNDANPAPGLSRFPNAEVTQPRVITAVNAPGSTPRAVQCHTPDDANPPNPRPAVALPRAVNPVAAPPPLQSSSSGLDDTQYPLNLFASEYPLAPGYRRFPLPPVECMKGMEGALGAATAPPDRLSQMPSSIWTRFSRLPTTIPKIYAAHKPEIGPVTSTIPALVSKQKKTDKALVALLCRLNDVAVFVEHMQAERNRNYDTLASLDDSYRYRQCYLDSQMNRIKEDISELINRANALEDNPLANQLKDAIIELESRVDGTENGLDDVKSQLEYDSEESLLEVVCRRIQELENLNAALVARVQSLELARDQTSEARPADAGAMETRLRALETLILQMSLTAPVVPAPSDVIKKLEERQGVEMNVSPGGLANVETPPADSSTHPTPIAPCNPATTIPPNDPPTSSSPCAPVPPPALASPASVMPVLSTPALTSTGPSHLAPSLPIVSKQAPNVPTLPPVPALPANLQPVPASLSTQALNDDSPSDDIPYVQVTNPTPIKNTSNRLRAQSISALESSRTATMRRSPRFHTQREEEQVDFEQTD